MTEQTNNKRFSLIRWITASFILGAVFTFWAIINSMNWLYWTASAFIVVIPLLLKLIEIMINKKSGEQNDNP